MSRFRVMVKTEALVTRIYQKSYTMRFVADQAGISSSYLSDLIYRRRSVSAEMSEKLLKALLIRGQWDRVFEVQTYTNTSVGVG